MINRKIIFQLNLYIIALNAQLYQPFHTILLILIPHLPLFYYLTQSRPQQHIYIHRFNY